MATSRTGTAKWKHQRARALRAARHAGLERCPLCGIRIDWNGHKTPASPEVDHIVAHARGGSDELDNLRVICQRCNRSRGGKERATANRSKTARRRPRIIRTNHQDSW